MSYFARTESTANGVQTAFAVGFSYQNQADVVVYVHAAGAEASPGAAKGLAVDYDFTSVGIISFRAGSVPAAGQVVDIRRSTKLTALDNSILSGGTLKAAQLAQNDTQLLYLEQERVDVDVDLATRLGSLEAWRASGTLKGDPGANVLAIGTFAQASGLVIPAGTSLVQVSGTATNGDLGSGRQFVFDAAVDATYVAANPLTSFRDNTPVTKRGFREINPATGTKLTPILLIDMGQSNSAGAYAGGANPAYAAVMAWNSQSAAWGSSDYTQAPWTLAEPDGNGGFNNAILAAACKLYELTRRPVGIVYDFQGGRPISDWVGAGTASVRYAALKSKVQAALASPFMALNGVTVITAGRLAQGEEDFTRNAAAQLTDLQTLDAQLRAETWMTAYTPMFVTGMSALHERYEVADALKHLPETIPGWRYVDCLGLPTNVAGADFTHFTGPAIFEIGYNILAPLIASGRWHRAEPTAFNPYWNRGNGKLSVLDTVAIASYISRVTYGSRTAGPGVTDPFTGDGATTAFKLTVRGGVAPAYGITAVTVNGVAKVLTTDYTIAQAGNDRPILTFLVAPANLAAIVITYGSATSGPSGLYSLSEGYRCCANGDYSVALGYLSYVPAGIRYCTVIGRGGIAGNDGDVILGPFPKYIDGSRKHQGAIGTSDTVRKNAWGVHTSGNFEFQAPSTGADPGQLEDITFRRVDDTHIKLLMKGADGTVRSVTLGPLA